MPRKRLADDVRLHVVHEDETPFGSALDGGADDAIRRACAFISSDRERNGMEDLVRRSKEVLGRAFEGDLASRYTRPGVLREDCLYPPAERVRPIAIVASREGEKLVAIGVDASALPELAPRFGELQRGTSRPSAVIGRAFFDLLEGVGALVEGETLEPAPPSADVVFVGHATALICQEQRLLVDPFLLPTSSRYPASYQPLTVSDLLPIDAVFITHSHPDHFDLGTLLRLGADTPIYVPHVERESLLAIDMAGRLEQLGFNRVTRVRHGSQIPLGTTRVHAHPFYGEQPTTGEALHPEVRNVGCTYSFVSADRHVLAIADSGRDREGDVRDLAATVVERWGPPDVLLGGYRGFALYPIQYIFSSVARFVLFVPEADRAARIVPMNDCDALIDTAERCAAKLVVPYADGGAPWYWERGLGPRLDGTGKPNPSADPPPEDVLRHAALRSTWFDEPIGSSVAVSLVRPGERLHMDTDGSMRIDRGPRQQWPYAALKWHQSNVALARIAGSKLASARAVFGTLEPAVASWRKEGRLTRFFFMRKQPDLRLRFFGAESLGPDVSALLSGLFERGLIERCFASEYEPEIARFGGPRAMDAIHRWFDADTAAWMRLDALESNGKAKVDALSLALAVTGDVVAGLLEDPAEAWAMWRSYAESFELEADDSAAPLVPVGLETLGSVAGPEIRSVLASYQDANRAVVRELATLRDRGELLVGMRGILVAFVMFHLNRHAFDVAGHARVVWTMLRALAPPAPSGAA
jgi:thiopeptide-type bacteriocin biosynthesis protein